MPILCHVFTVTVGLPQKFTQTPWDFSGILCLPKGTWCRVKIFSGIARFPSRMMALRWHWCHQKTSCDYLKLPALYRAIFPISQYPHDDLEILAMTSRSFHSHRTATLRRLKDCPISHTLPQYHLKVIARHSVAWLQYLLLGCSNHFCVINAGHPIICNRK